MQIKFSIVIIICSILVQSCSFFDTDEPIPTYLELNNPTLSVNGVVESHNIKDVWVFQDGQILGVFPFPAKVPIVSTKSNVEIKILAGVRKDGINELAINYPFYKEIVTTVEISPNSSKSIPLNFTFVDNCKIPINENFEIDHNFTLDLDMNTASKIEIDPTTSTVGSHCGIVKMTSATSYVQVASTLDISSNQIAGGASFVEFDYKGSGEIAVGVIKITNGHPVIEEYLFIPGKETWNRIYVDLTDKLQALNFDSYRIILSFRKNNNVVSSSLYIDNLKHVHF